MQSAKGKKRGSGKSISPFAFLPLHVAFIPVLLLFVSSLLSGCYTITRTEEDLYTITQSDTTIREEVHNPPGDRENGTIYPSPRTVQITREYVQRDSTVERHYPAFLRFGGIETAGFFSTGSTDSPMILTPRSCAWW